MNNKTTFPKEDLLKRLTSLQFKVTQEKGTERAFTGAYWNTKDKGDYLCIVCGEKLFDSSTKYDSGTGWPSFWDCERGTVEKKTDNSFGMSRNEVHCAKCGAHLGHIFNDGPKPTGVRYCTNSASLLFRKK